MGRTVNPLSFDFSGSNPLLPTPFLTDVKRLEKMVKCQANSPAGTIRLPFFTWCMRE